MKHFAMLVLLGSVAVSGCVTPPVAKQEADPVLQELARAASLAANSNRILAEVAVAQNRPEIRDEVAASLATEPTTPALLAPYQFDFVGPVSAAVKAVAAKIGWNYEERGNPERAQLVQLSGSMTGIAALRSISDQITWNLVADERAKMLVLDYTRQAPLHRIEDNASPIPVTPVPPAHGKWYILTGTFGREYVASSTRMMKKYRKAGLHATRVDDGQAQYVFIGPFTSQAEAQVILTNGKAKGRIIEKGMTL